jgi:hypothetical protein
LNVDANTLYVDGTNNRVGIGTATPSQALHIYKEDANAVLRVSSLADLGSALSEIRTESYDLGGNGSSVHSKISIVTSEGDPTAPTSVLAGRTFGTLRFMTNHAGTDLDLSGIKATTHPITYDAANRRSRLTFYTTSTLTPEDRMMIDYNGYVGIGTTSPNALLTVEGALSVKEMAAPAQTADYGKIYAKTDGKLYFLNDGGTEYDLTATGSGGLTSLNGETGSTQTFAIGTSGNSPAWSSATDTHTLNIPLASAAGTVTAGLISNAQYARIPASGTTNHATLRWSGTAWVETTGLTIDASGNVVLAADPDAAMEAATKQYVDAAFDASNNLTTDNVLPKWDNTNNEFIMSSIIDDGTYVKFSNPPLFLDNKIYMLTYRKETY